MKNFTWVEIYNAIAKKMLKYKNNSEELANIMYKSLEESGLMYSEEKGANLDNDGKKRCRYKEIDPISFMNRFEMYSYENKRKFIEAVERNLGTEIDIPNDFDGLPSTNPQKSSVIRSAKDREKEDIPNIWKLFEIALNMDFNNNDDRNKFIEIYDKVISKPVAKFNISVGLFKIRPDIFLNLDYTNREYLVKRFNIKINDRIYGKEYLELLDDVKEKLGNETLLEFSYKAWNSKGSNDDKNMKIKNTNESKQYFWLNANPKIWSFSELKNGEIIEYTAVNENGNKRRIYKNYLNAKKGDLVIAYESTPIKAIAGICVVEEELKDNILKIKKLETLINPIPYSEILNEKDLENMEYMKNPQGSLFVLNEIEFNVIMDMIRDLNPLVKKEFKSYSEEDFLKDVFISDIEYNRLSKLLLKKKNIILQGAPGVGKTFMSKRLAYSIIGKKDDEKIKTIQFHQNYSYEDFIEGYRPNENGYELEKGIFYNFCKKAENDPNEPYFFIIDEINRGNLSKIFGELMMLIESDKRGEKLILAYSKVGFSVPENLYIIGMMNTADRSLALMDYALRRRFAFYKVKPAFESNIFKAYSNKLNSGKFNKLIECVKLINNDIDNDLSLGEGFEIGHSYFCNFEKVTDEDIKLIVDYEILPLLEEYWFDDTDKYNEWKDKLNGVVNG